MAKTPPADPNPTLPEINPTRSVRLLLDCAHGRVNSVVELPEEEVAALVAAGHADDDPQAVAYALELQAAAAAAQA